MIPNTTITRIVKNVGSSHSAFSGCGGGSVIHGKIARLPNTATITSSRNATGSHATKPSMIRTVGRDHRAVVIRWAAAMATPADDTVVTNSQLTWYACHARA